MSPELLYAAFMAWCYSCLVVLILVAVLTIINAIRGIK